MNPLLQNMLILSVMLGFAGMEWASRRYKNTVQASADDTKLELAMFLSLIAVAQPLAILVTGKLSAWLTALVVTVIVVGATVTLVAATYVPGENFQIVVKG